MKLVVVPVWNAEQTNDDINSTNSILKDPKRGIIVMEVEGREVN
jgi:hypothetical protein